MSTATPPAVSLESIIAQLQESGLVPPDQLAPFIPPAAYPLDPQAFTAQLVERGLLTKFQASQVATGKTKSLVIGAYVMLDRVGGGGGLLFKAMHRRMQRVVLIKPLAPSLMKTAAPRVQREVASAGRVAHPNLVAVQDLDEVGGAHFLVTEFVDGYDLATIVTQQGKLALDRGCGFVAQTAEALAALHAQSQTHRDVRAENLFVDRSGAVKLFGLGIAAAETGDAAGDVAALGRLLYRLLIGADLPAGVAPSLKAARPEVSQALEGFFLRLLSATPSERPTAAEVAAALKLSEMTAPAATADAGGDSMFPELFAGAEEEAPTVMSAPFDPATLPPMNPPAGVPSPSPTPAAVTQAAIAPVQMSVPTVPPAPSAPAAPNMPSPNLPLPGNVPAAPFMPTPAAAMSPAIAPAPAPASPFAINPAPAPAASAASPFAVNTAPAPAADSPFAINMASAPAAESEVAVVSAADGGDEGLGFATIEAPGADAFGGTQSFSTTTTATTTASRKAGKSTKAKKPIDLPFNLKLDPKYLETKYVAGAGAGVIVLFTLLIWAIAGGSKPAKVQAVPAVPVVKTPKPAEPPPGMFQLPQSDSLSSVAPAGGKPRPVAIPTATGAYDMFGLPVDGAAKEKKKR